MCCVRSHRSVRKPLVPLGFQNCKLRVFRNRPPKRPPISRGRLKWPKPLVRQCRCVGIGRRGGLKIHWWRHRAGSTPATGTIPKPLREQGFGIFFDLPGDDIWCGCFCYRSDIFPCRRIFRVCNPLSQRFSRFFGGRWRTIYALADAGDSSEAGKKPRIAWADATLEL